VEVMTETRDGAVSDARDVRLADLDFTVVDVETTGWAPDDAGITEIGAVLVAHNAPFDLRFLTAACAGMGLGWPGFEVLDTVRLARHLMATPQEVPDRKLATLAGFFGTPVRPSHRALDDARATAAVLGRLLARLAEREAINTLAELDAWLATRDAAAAAAAAAAAERPSGAFGPLARLLGRLARWRRAPRGHVQRGS